MKFRHVAATYALVWCALIIVMCVWEWFGLKSFQTNYDIEKSKQNLMSSMRQESGVEVSGTNDFVQGGNSSGAEYTNSAKGDLIWKEIIMDNTMHLYVNGEPVAYSIEHPVEDIIYQELSELTGKEYMKGAVKLQVGSKDQIKVTDYSGQDITPLENDYTLGEFFFEENITEPAKRSLEVYLRYINGLASSTDLYAGMRGDSQVYRALMRSAESLQWMIKSRSMEFTKEEVSNVIVFDADHYACDVVIELTKIPDTERERVVQETVHYRVLMERYNGVWMMYAFVTM